MCKDSGSSPLWRALCVKFWDTRNGNDVPVVFLHGFASHGKPGSHPRPLHKLRICFSPSVVSSNKQKQSVWNKTLTKESQGFINPFLVFWLRVHLKQVMQSVWNKTLKKESRSTHTHMLNRALLENVSHKDRKEAHVAPCGSGSKKTTDKKRLSWRGCVAICFVPWSTANWKPKSLSCSGWGSLQNDGVRILIMQ